MALADDIRALRDHVFAELTAAHDYFEDTKQAWSIVDGHVAAGNRFSYRNQATGTVNSQTDLVAKADIYVLGPLAEATFQQFLAIFEGFVFDLLRRWLLAFPRNLIGKKVDMLAVLDAPDKDAIILSAVNKELNEILYDRPTGWFAYLEEKLKLGCPTPDEIDRIAEAKASRDVLAHNRGVAGRTYVVKAGKYARYQPGEFIDIPEPYHRATWELLRKVAADIANAAAAKAP